MGCYFHIRTHICSRLDAFANALLCYSVSTSFLPQNSSVLEELNALTEDKFPQNMAITEILMFTNPNKKQKF